MPLMPGRTLPRGARLPRTLALALALVAGAARPARAQAALPATASAPIDTTVLSIHGAGPTTFVLLSGLVGGAAQFDQLRSHLVRDGHRVVVIDPYRLSLDSADVTFAALARRTEALLARHGIDSARVVGHAHGAGVALRLAAAAPARVSALYLLGAGALPGTRTRVLSASLRLVPLIARMPGGRAFVRRRLVHGLRENAGREEWLDAAAQRRYTEPFLARLDAAVAMGGRLARAREPDSVSLVIARVQAPVTVLVGAAPHPAAPSAAELAALAPLGDRLRIERLPGVGHFPHEEAVADVVRCLTAAPPPF